MNFLNVVAIVFGVLLGFFVNRLLLPFLLSQPNYLAWVGIALIAFEFCFAIWFIISVVESLLKPKPVKEITS
jgi:multisubunit Na+/H+ antiporter MnhE subunit